MSEPFARAPGQLSIDVWSDVVCPFCYMGDTILAKALSEFEHSDAVVVRYHSYQLMPELPADQPVDLVELLSASKGLQPEQVLSMHRQLAARGAELGIDYRFAQTQTINTRAAHRLTHYANAEGEQRALVQRLFLAYFTQGRNIGDYEVLADLADEVGLDRASALAALEADEYAAAVDSDIALAQQLGITGVPFFVFNGRFAVSGAQPVEVFADVLQKAWAQG